MATIDRRKGKNGDTYRVRVRVGGLPPKVKTFKRLTDAKQWANEVESGLLRGEFTNVVKEAKSHTLATVIQRYRDEILIEKATTTQRAEKVYLDYWDRELGMYALSLLDATTINNKLAEFTKAGDTRFKGRDEQERPRKPKAKKTVKNYRDCLELILKYAKQWELTGSNPMEKVNRITRINNARVRFLSDGERTALLAACKASTNPRLYPIVVFALSTGARHGEIMNLTFDDLDWQRDLAILRDTKNGETRSVPIVKHLKFILAEHAETTETFYDELGDVKTRWLFPRSDGLAPIDIRKAWETARRKSGIKDFRFHDLRHSAASYLAMNGATLLEIATILGHRTLQMVKRYSHLSENHTHGVVSRMNENIF